MGHRDGEIRWPIRCVTLIETVESHLLLHPTPPSAPERLFRRANTVNVSLIRPGNRDCGGAASAERTHVPIGPGEQKRRLYPPRASGHRGSLQWSARLL